MADNILNTTDSIGGSIVDNQNFDIDKRGKVDPSELSNWDNFKLSMSNAFEESGDVFEFFGIGTGDKTVEEVAEAGELGAYAEIGRAHV